MTAYSQSPQSAPRHCSVGWTWRSITLPILCKQRSLLDPPAARQQVTDVMSALLAQHPELRQAFHGMWIHADVGNGSLFALDLPMSGTPGFTAVKRIFCARLSWFDSQLPDPDVIPFECRQLLPDSYRCSCAACCPAGEFCWPSDCCCFLQGRVRVVIRAACEQSVCHGPVRGLPHGSLDSRHCWPDSWSYMPMCTGCEYRGQPRTRYYSPPATNVGSRQPRPVSSDSISRSFFARAASLPVVVVKEPD